jgi:diguanylate cyclase (GGDEF)-like protein
MLQTLYFGTTVLWVSVAISLLIVYINIQTNQLYTDHLTGLNNRRQLDNYLADQIRKKAKNGLLAGIMIDIDSFKEINDFYGHAVGDQALEKMGGILKDCFRKDDFIARYGGDEFVVFFEVDEIKDMENAVQRIRKNVEECNNSQRSTLPHKIKHGL